MSEPLDLDAIDALADAATEGPWVLHDRNDAEWQDHVVRPVGAPWWWIWQESRLPYWGGVLSMQPDHPDDDAPGLIGELTASDGGVMEPLQQEYDDAKFIAWTREGVPDLVRRLRAAEAEIQRLRALHD